MADVVRVRAVDDVVLAFLEPDIDLGEDFERLLVAIEAPTVRKLMVLTVGPIQSNSERRRRMVAAIRRHDLRLIGVTGDRYNRGLAGMLSYLGVPTALFPWSELAAAARSVAARPELVDPIVRCARSLRAESPAAFGLEEGEG